MELYTQRLLLRPWKEEDAEELYLYAKDPLVGPRAGWPAHKSVKESLGCIKGVLSKPETYAVVLKSTGLPIGSVGIKTGKDSEVVCENEGELGYWIGVPHWGQGYAVEAVKELMRHAFEDMQLGGLWCGYFDGNIQSKRVQEKCGFEFHFTRKDRLCPLLNEKKTEHYTYISKADWQKAIK